MFIEAPVQLLGQNAFNASPASGTGVVIIQSGQNTRGVILRTAIIANSSGMPPGGTPPALFADFGLGPFVPPPPPPPGGPTTTRYILFGNNFTGMSQLNWPVYLDPGLGLAFSPASGGGASVNLYLTWDHATLAPT